MIQHETEAEGVPLARRPLGLSSEMAGKLIGRMLYEEAPRSWPSSLFSSPQSTEPTALRYMTRFRCIAGIRTLAHHAFLLKS